MSMLFLNEITISGRLTQKPELRYFTNSDGKEVAFSSIRIGFKEKRNSSKSGFINVELYGQKAVRICEKCDKGSLVLVKGSFRRIKYTNKEGQTRYKVDILCESIRQIEGVRLNCMEISGYLARKPELKVGKGKNDTEFFVTNTAIAFRDKRDYGTSYFIDIAVFGEDAKRLCEIADKGTPIYLKGNLRNSSYINKDGEKRIYLQVIVEEFQKIYLNKNMTNQVIEDKAPENKSNESPVIDTPIIQKDSNFYGFDFIEDNDLPF